MGSLVHYGLNQDKLVSFRPFQIKDDLSPVHELNTQYRNPEYWYRRYHTLIMTPQRIINPTNATNNFSQLAILKKSDYLKCVKSKYCMY